MKEILVSIAVAVTLFVVGLFSYPLDFSRARDSSDSPAKRSGFSIHVDALTQCHYLSRRGSLTPRLGPDGKQLCGKDIPE